jgi:HEAT repeat protein
VLADGDPAVLPALRAAAADPRWRVREACAMALQRLGDERLDRMFEIAGDWAGGDRLEQRAAVAAVCEPRLLRDPASARRAVSLLDRVTESVSGAGDRGTEPFRVLRQALGYGWSVAVVAVPDGGKESFERWLKSDDANVRWIVRENLKKSRLARMDSGWVESCRARIAR